MKINVTVRTDRQRKDGSYPVSFRFSHRSRTKYAPTGHNVKAITKSGYIRDKALSLRLDERALEMEELFRDDPTLDEKPIEEIIDCLMKRRSVAVFNDDFVAYALRIADEMKMEQKQHGGSIRTLANSISDYVDHKTLPFNVITADFIKGYRAFLKEERTMVRVNQLGKHVKTKSAPISEETVNNYLRWMRATFNKAKIEYNDEERGIMRILGNPFKTIKISNPKPQRRGSIEIELLRKMANLDNLVVPGAGTNNRANLARDMFLLSFGLIGMNSVDIYKLPAGCLDNDVLTYERSKSFDRKGGSTMRIRLTKETLRIIKRYAAKSGEFLLDIHNRYADANTFNKAINKGLETVSELVGSSEKITYYSARRSWANIAREVFHADKFLIADALNHANNTVTDFYIDRDWQKIWELNSKVNNHIYSEDKRQRR